MIPLLLTSWKNLLPPSSAKSSMWCLLCRVYGIFQLCFTSVHEGGSLLFLRNNVLSLAALKKTAILATIPTSWTANFSYYHSFGMSENYLVFIEQPLIINSMKLITSQIKGRCMRDCMTWSPDERVMYCCSPVHVAWKMYVQTLPDSCSFKLHSFKN